MTEALSPPAATSSGQPEQPTGSARLTIDVRPTQLKGSAEGNVPGHAARVLITTFGMIAMGATGILGAVLTAYISPPRDERQFLGLALAELALALVVILLIARGGTERPGPTARETAHPGPSSLTSYDSGYGDGNPSPPIGRPLEPGDGASWPSSAAT